MEPSPPKKPAPEPERAPPPGGTMLRFKRLTNHLFGIGKPPEAEDDKK